MARTEQGDEVANCSERLNKRGYSGNSMPQQFPRKWCLKKKKTARSRGEVEKARHHDEGYCNGSATT
jgi:hypothetical protein